jgi:hypothetical protein
MQADPITAATADMLATANGRRGNDSSATWTTSSGGMGTFHSDLEDLEDRSPFVDEYNRLAKKVCPATSACITGWCCLANLAVSMAFVL